MRAFSEMYVFLASTGSSKRAKTPAVQQTTLKASHHKKPTSVTRRNINKN